MAVTRTDAPAMSPAYWKRLREEVLKLTQVELARELGMSHVTMWRYESGRAPIEESRAAHLLLLIKSKGLEVPEDEAAVAR